MSENKATSCCETEVKSTSTCCCDGNDECQKIIVIVNLCEGTQGKNSRASDKSCCSDEREGPCC